MTSVAIVHDVLAARAGGERLLLAIANAFPDARIHTLVYEPASTFDEFAGRDITTSFLNRSARLRRMYRYTVPVAALTMAATTIDAGVTICATSGLSHHVRTTGAKIVYCHTPARWLHDTVNYLHGYGRAVHLAATVLAPPLRRLDRRAMQTAVHTLANSVAVAAEIQNIYGITADVLAPCSTLRLDGPVAELPGVDAGFVLCPARPLGYKRLDVLLDAARLLPNRQFVHLGAGPHQRLFAAAPPNVVSFGSVSDDQLRWAYRHAGVVALTCAEDFGLVPLEAAAHGVHSVAPSERGLLDHDRSLLTMYRFGDGSALAEALEAAPLPSGRCDATHLGIERFTDRLQAVVEAYT